MGMEVYEIHLFHFIVIWILEEQNNTRIKLAYGVGE